MLFDVVQEAKAACHELLQKWI